MSSDDCANKAYVDDNFVKNTEVVANTYTANTVAKRTATGTIHTNTPQWGNEAANKSYVDTNFTPKPDIGNCVPFFDAHLNPGKILINQNTDGTTAPQAYRFGRYMESGEFPVGTPTQPYYAANKGYIDDNFVPKIQFTSGRLRFNVCMPNGELSAAEVANGDAVPTGYAFSRANGAGNLSTATPTKDVHAANKGYVDDNFVKQVTFDTENGDGTLQGFVYVVDKYNIQTTKDLRIVGKFDSIPVRNANGNFYVGDPTLDYECANKRFVDRNKGTKLYKHEITSDAMSSTLIVYTATSAAYTNSNIAAIKDDWLTAKYNGKQVTEIQAVDNSSLSFGAINSAGFAEEIFINFLDYTITDTVTAL